MYTTVNLFQPAFNLLAQMRSNLGASATSKQSGPCTETLYFQNRLAQVEWHASGYVYVGWKNAAPCSAEFRAVFHYVRALLNMTNCTMVLLDQTKMQLPTAADLEWLAQEWTPAAVRETNYSYRAIIAGHKHQTQPESAHNDAQSALTTQFFNDSEAAARWLRSIYV